MPAKAQTQNPRRLVTREEARDRLRICQATLDNYVKRGFLPRPLKIGPSRAGRVCWLESDIEAFFDRLEAERNREVENRDREVA